MKLKYDELTGEILCMGEMLNLEGAVEVNFSIPAEPLNFYTFNGSALVRKPKDIIGRILALNNFDLVQFQGDLAAAAVAGQFTMSDPIIEFAPLNTYATNLDFEGMKSYILWRIATGKAQASDYGVVNAITKLQNIDLDTFGT